MVKKKQFFILFNIKIRGVQYEDTTKKEIMFTYIFGIV